MDPKIAQSVEFFLKELFQIAGETARVQLTVNEDGLFVSLQGAHIFVGQNQQALRSLAHLAEIYLKRTLNSDLSVYMDADGYRDRRRAELREMAFKLAEEAVRERKRIVFDPMQPYERKAVHEALSQISGVRTHSEGSDDERRVVIEPIF